MEKKISVFHIERSLFWISNPLDILNLRSKFRIQGFLIYSVTFLHKNQLFLKLDLEEILLGIEFGFLRLKKFSTQSQKVNLFSLKNFFSKNNFFTKTPKNYHSFFFIKQWRENLYVIFKNLKKNRKDKEKNFSISKNYFYAKKNCLDGHPFAKFDLEILLKKFNISKFIDFLIFRDLWQRGFILTCGIKFGSTYTAYAGNISFFHSCTSVFSLNYFNNIFSIDLISFGRVGTSTKKRTIFAFLSKKLFVSYFGIKWLRDLP
mmetsp:Transcript_15697/g.39469  ORF Transcript_15697/g.39469 Transcript_15697/m.39469 type:complete len:261 (-) Transcript_15697:774-1556(-)